jgi:Domain of unknown function (DUF3597)
MSILKSIFSVFNGHRGPAPSESSQTTAPPRADAAENTVRASGIESTPSPASSGPGRLPSTPEFSSPPAIPPSAFTPAIPAGPADVVAVLDGLAASHSGILDWRHSIVDLLKLLGLDSSPAARKKLATELHYPGDSGNSAEMNVWLHQQVLTKLAENGGTVPAELFV